MANLAQEGGIPFRLRVPLSQRFRFTHEPVDGTESERFIGRERQIETLADRIAFSSGGAFLITGYRGIGKTSFINQILTRLERAAALKGDGGPSRVVGIPINLARSLAPVELIFLVLRYLYLELRERGILREIDRDVARELKLTYDRTSMDIKETHSSAQDLTLAGPIAKLGATAGYKRTQVHGGEMTFRPYQERAAEYDLIRLSRRILRSWRGDRPWWERLTPWKRPASGALRIVFVFDELDKIDDAQELDALFSLLKNLFTTSGLTFLFVAGKDVQERWGKESGRGESIYESVFACETYLPCLWDGVPGLCGRHLETSGAAAEDVEAVWRSIAFQGRGIPRRILRTFNQYVRWIDGQPSLALTPYEFRDVQYYAGLEGMLSDFRQRLLRSRGAEATAGPDDDKRALGLYYLLDWILQRGNGEFTLADTIAAYEALNPKVVLVGAMSSDIQALLETLRSLRYIEIASTLGNKQFVRPNEKVAEQYRLIRTARPEWSAGEKAPADPAQLGPYRILAAIGAGGMAKVAKAVHADTNQIVAVKYTQEPGEAVRYLIRSEAQALSGLTHFGIPIFYSFDEDQNSQVLAMEFIDGPSLHRLLALQRKLPAEAAAEIALALAGICAHIHSKGYAHGDLKPSNILLDADGRVVLSDFSAARQIDAPLPSFGLAGTPAYMAPELLAGKPSSARSDIYGLGVLLYEVLSGHIPFVTERLVELTERVARGLPPRLGLTRQNQDLEALVMQCLATDPTGRPSSMDEVAARAKEIGHGTGTLRSLIAAALRRTSAGVLEVPKDEVTQIGFPQARGAAQAAAAAAGPPPFASPPSFSYPSPPTPPPPAAPPAAPRPPAAPVTGDFTELFSAVRPAPVSAPPPGPGDFTRMYSSVAAPTFMAWLDAVLPNGGSLRYPLRPATFRIGRSEQAEICVEDDSLSRLHAEILFQDGNFHLLDIGSLNGTYLNGKRIPSREPVLLKDGDSIRIGRWAAAFHRLGHP